MWKRWKHLLRKLSYNKHMKYYLILIVVAALLVAFFSMEKIKTEYEYTDINNLKVDTIDTTDTIANDWCETHKCKE